MTEQFTLWLILSYFIVGFIISIWGRTLKIGNPPCDKITVNIIFWPLLIFLTKK